MRRNMLKYTIPMFLAVLLLSPPAHANAGFPIVFPLWMIGWGAMFVALLPIIAIEAIVLWVRAGTALWESGLAASLGNVTSTVIGIPVAMIIHTTLREWVGDKPVEVETAWQRVRMVVFQIQYEARETSGIPDWMWPGGCLVLMVPCFLASWLSEFWIARMLLGDYPETALDQAVFEANLVTYGILAALLIASLVWKFWNPSLASNPRVNLVLVAEWEDRLRSDDELDEGFVGRWRFVNAQHEDPWRFANEWARQGIARLAVAEAEIARQRPIRVDSDVQRFEDAYDEKAA